MSKENGATELKCFIWVVTRQIQESGIIADLAYSLFLEVFSDLLIHYWLLWILAFTSLFIISLVHASGLLLSFFIAWKIARSWGEVEYITVANPGEKPGGRPPPLIFRPNWGPKGRKKLFLRPPPLSQGLDGSLTFGVGVRSFRVYMIYAQFSPVPDFIPFFNGRGLVFNWLQPQGFRMTKSKSP